MSINSLYNVLKALEKIVVCLFKVDWYEILTFILVKRLR
jgi:hypothetical protein